LSEPGESEDFGPDWRTPEALERFGDRVSTPRWAWMGPETVVAGPTWGGCLEVLDQLALAGRFPMVSELEGTILLVETSEEIPPVEWVRRCMRALGERGILQAIAGMVLARPPASSHESIPSADEQDDYRHGQREAVFEELDRYNPEAVACAGVPFGHTRPAWIVPYGGRMSLDARLHTVTADYD
jgi:muramoyltetrapeptide carboxypeptidase LdcA involved in peptidoglycan recycling